MCNMVAFEDHDEPTPSVKTLFVNGVSVEADGEAITGAATDRSSRRTPNNS